MADPISISPKYTDQCFGGKPSLDDKITIFEDRVLGWQIAIAEALHSLIRAPENEGKPIQHGGFVLLGALFSYFEMIAQYQHGEPSKGKAGDFFGRGLNAVFPGKFTATQQQVIWDRIRNGMYHSALTKKGALIDGDYTESIEIDGGTVKVNPHLLVAELRTHFEGYVGGLRSGKEDRAKFEQMYDFATQP